MEELIKNKNLIYKIAQNFKTNDNFDDLFQVGFIGLIEAYNNYDSSYGTKFSTYAYPYILGEMKKYVRENKNIKISKDMIRLSLKIENARNCLEQEMMREPTIGELSEFLDIDEDIIISAFISYECASLDRENECGNLYDVIPDDGVDYTTFIMLKEEIDSLPEPERTIIIKRYLEDNTQSEVAQYLNKNQVFVSRCESKALKLIKTRLT